MHLKFYPSYYLHTKPYARAALKAMGSYSTEITPRIAEQIASSQLLSTLEKQGVSAPTLRAGNLHVFSQEMQGILAFGQWASNGRQVVSVSPPLAQAFSLSDCGDMQVRDVFPSSAPRVFYVHFGTSWGPPYFLDAECPLEGAYVFMAPSQSLRIVLCSRGAEGKGPLEQWRERYDLRILASYFDMPAQDAITYSLAADLQDLEKARAQMIANGASATTLSSVDTLRTRMTEGQPAYQAAVSFILNALAYQKVYEPDGPVSWPEGTPVNLLRQAQTGGPNEKKRALSKLWGLGHIPAQELGGAFQLKAAGPNERNGLRAHWRRGHWRNQPHGPLLSLRKLIWIWPVLGSTPA